MIVTRVGALLVAGLALVFGLVALVLARSADPITAFAPLCIVVFLAVCAVELWRDPGVRSLRRRRMSAATRGRQAPAHVEF